MSSRPIRRSPPLIRWKNLSSSDRRASPVRKSFEQEKFSGISHHHEDGHSTDRPPYYSGVGRSKYQFSALSTDYRQRDHPSVGSRNLKTASRSYWRHPQYNAARTFIPRKRYSPVVKSSADADYELRSMKRVRSHEDLSDNFPFKRSKQQIERRYDSHQSRCPPEYKSGDRWQSPPCRRSKEMYRDVSQNYEYDRVHISRDSATNMKKRSENSRRESNNHSDKEQCSTSGKHQFSDDTLDKYYKALDKKASKDDVLQGSKRDFGSNLDLDHDDRKFGHLNRNREKIMENARQSPLLYRQNSRGKALPEKRAQCLQGRIEAQSINPRRRRESFSEANTRQKDGTDEMLNRHSKDSTKLDNFSKVKPSDENDLSWTASGNQSRRRSLSSASNSSYNSSQVSTTVRSRESSESKGSRRDLNADIHVKAQVLEFNPDFVVIVRRHNEGERPLCSREEFSETVLKPVSDNKQDSERKNAPSPDRAPAFENVSPKPDGETAPRESSSSAYKDSPVSFQKEKSVDVKIAGDLGEKPSSCDNSSTSVSDSSIVSAKRRDERIVTSERTTSLNNSSGTIPQNADLISDAEEEPPMLKKKNPFDLRQRIAERRLLRTGEVNISRTVQQFPNRSKNINEPFIRVSSMETCQNQSYAQRPVFNRHPFYRRKPAPRRSVILRQSH